MASKPTPGSWFRAAATTSSTGAANSARDTGSISHPEMARNGFS